MSRSCSFTAGLGGQSALYRDLDVFEASVDELGVFVDTTELKNVDECLLKGIEYIKFNLEERPSGNVHQATD